MCDGGRGQREVSPALSAVVFHLGPRLRAALLAITVAASESDKTGNSSSGFFRQWHVSLVVSGLAPHGILVPEAVKGHRFEWTTASSATLPAGHLCLAATLGGVHTACLFNLRKPCLS